MHLYFKNLFHKKKLTLREIHSLYLILKDCLPAKEEDYLLDEIDKVLDAITPDALMKSMQILKRDFSNKQGIEILNLFIAGLKENNFFEYVHFIKGLNG